MDLETLYSMLFNEQTTEPADFNTLVENGMKLISDIVAQNMTKETLEKFLVSKVQAKDEHKKAITMFWRSEAESIMSALRTPTSSCNEGLAHIDW